MHRSYFFKIFGGGSAFFSRFSGGWNGVPPDLHSLWNQITRCLGLCQPQW